MALIISFKCPNSVRLFYISNVFKFPTKGPSIPIAHRDKKIRNTLNLFLTEDFCSQNQWLPVSYYITYYPHDDVSLGNVKEKGYFSFPET